MSIEQYTKKTLKTSYSPLRWALVHMERPLA